MIMPDPGTRIEVVVRDYEPYLPTGRRETTKSLVGIVIPTPKWMQVHAALSILNEQTKAQNHIASHLIISIGGVKVKQPTVTPDKVFTVISSKTGEPYTVRQDGRTKKWSCTCIGFQFHKKCRHVTRQAEAA